MTQNSEKIQRKEDMGGHGLEKGTGVDKVEVEKFQTRKIACALEKL